MKETITMATGKKSDGAILIGKDEVIHTFNLGELFRNPTWNARASEERDATPDDDEMKEGGVAWADFKKSIRQGQDTPVIVRPCAGKHGARFELVCGFRRCQAIAEIAAEDKATPYVKAVVRTMNDSEARLLNLRENTARNSLSGADLVYGIKDYLAQNPGVSSVTMAANIGKNQSYIAMVMRIASGLTPELLKSWRDDSTPHPMKKIDEIAKASKGEQKALYEALRATGDGGTSDENAWVDKAKKEAEDIGTKLGTVRRLGGLELTDEDSFFADYLRTFVKFKKAGSKGHTDKLQNQIVRAFKAGYVKGCSEPEEEEETETKGKK